jgi:hypothetical protein
LRRPCAKCGTNRHIKFYVSERGRVCSFCRKKRTVLASRDVRLQETYGITEAEYQQLLAAQGGACAICRGTRRENLDVDHCHRTSLIRGLLCRRCNRRLLPASQDKPERLRAAIEYLNQPPAPTVLGERFAPAKEASSRSLKGRRTSKRT